MSNENIYKSLISTSFEDFYNELLNSNFKDSYKLLERYKQGYEENFIEEEMFLTRLSLFFKLYPIARIFADKLRPSYLTEDIPQFIIDQSYEIMNILAESENI